MTITYNFDGNNYDYEIDYEQYQKALIHILLKEEKASLVEFLVGADGCKLDLEESFQDELKDHFEAKANKEYLDGRYE